ncbi:amino acid--tRNA ligase-related protein [Shigella flexneri]
MISNNESRNTFKVRSQILSGIRQFMVNRGFMEVETPMMQVIPGGAAARPFITHHNALDLDIYLRIAPELYLKRLVVGGFEHLFKINRNFRNEGISVRHNPEFTHDGTLHGLRRLQNLIELTESLFRTLAQDILGKTEVTYGDVTLDFGKPFEKLTMREAMRNIGRKPTWQIWITSTLRKRLLNLSVSTLRRAGYGPYRYRNLRRSGRSTSDSADLHY